MWHPFKAAKKLLPNEVVSHAYEKLMKSFLGKENQRLKKTKIISERGLFFGRWTCNPVISCSNPFPYHQMDLCSVGPNSTPPCFVNSQLVCLLPVGIVSYVMFILNYWFSLETIWKLAISKCMTTRQALH